MHGWLNLYKPVGVSSHRVLHPIKKLLPKKHKVGHAGTLDPMACGILPVAIGEASKTIPYMQNKHKVYEFTMYWGYQTTTGDIEGEVDANSGFTTNIPTAEQLTKALHDNFIGEITQTPPIYSAIKVDGRRAYELARHHGGNFASIKIPQRQVLISDIELLEHQAYTADKIVGHSKIKVKCSVGTYIRSLAQDIALHFAARSHIRYLCRLQVGKFSVENAVQPDGVDIQNLFVVGYPLDDILAWHITTEDLVRKIRHGLRVEYTQNQSHHLDSFVACYFRDKLVALGDVQGGFFLPKRVFNY
jgi:tRNA pseudouridine55 synthase